MSAVPVTATTPEGVVVEGPTPRGLAFVLTLTDPLTAESIEKVYRSRALAEQAMADLVAGTDGRRNVDPLAEPDERPGVFDDVVTSQLKPQHRPRYHTNGTEMTSEERAEAPRFNIRAVREVLEDYGLDPTAELARVLTERKPVMVNGVQAEDVDPLTGEITLKTEPVLRGNERAQILLELQQYVTPKLRAVEMKAEIKTPMSSDAIDARIAAIVDQHPELAAVVAQALAK